jgi:hypothetical protein
MLPLPQQPRAIPVPPLPQPADHVLRPVKLLRLQVSTPPWLCLLDMHQFLTAKVRWQEEMPLTMLTVAMTHSLLQFLLHVAGRTLMTAIGLMIFAQLLPVECKQLMTQIG